MSTSAKPHHGILSAQEPSRLYRGRETSGSLAACFRTEFVTLPSPTEAYSTRTRSLALSHTGSNLVDAYHVVFSTTTWHRCLPAIPASILLCHPRTRSTVCRPFHNVAGEWRAHFDGKIECLMSSPARC